MWMFKLDLWRPTGQGSQTVSILGRSAYLNNKLRILKKAVRNDRTAFFFKNLYFT